MVELLPDDLHDLRIPVTAGIDAEAAEAVDEFLIVEAVDISPLVVPLENGAVLRIGGDGLAVLEPARRDVIVKIVQRVADHFLLLRLRDVLRVLADETDDLVEILNDLLPVCCHPASSFCDAVRAALPVIMVRMLVYGTDADICTDAGARL